MAVMNHTRLPAIIFAAAAILFIISTVHQQRDHLPQAKSLWPFRGSRPSFYEIALKHGTDKVTTHSYQDMYEKYLPALRDKPIRLLEIGLGCDMNYGPGASYYTWLEYFPNIDLYFIEYDAACAQQWASKTTQATIVTGDQADVSFLESFVRKTTANNNGGGGGGFDIIIDDGGHSMDQQITSLKHLFQIVKPGGVYFCEDLQTSFDSRNAIYGGGDFARLKGNLTMVQFIAKMVEDLTSPVPRRVSFADAEEVVHVDCSREVCGFWKKGELSF